MSLGRRWLFAQHVEAEAWKDFGTAPRHFCREYWDWELGFLGWSLDYIESLASCALLEVGCGPFGMIHFIEAKGVRIGVEPLAVDLKSMGFGMAFVGGGRAFHTAAIGEALPIADETMDVVICFNVLDHAAAPERVLSECKRVLRPDGVLEFNVNVIRPSLTPLRPLLSRIDKPHPFHWTPDEVLQMMDDVGFDVLVKRYEPRKNYKFSLLNLLLPRMASNSSNRTVTYLRVGEDRYVPAKGSALRHLGSNLLHMRLDLRAQKRVSR